MSSSKILTIILNQGLTVSTIVYQENYVLKISLFRTIWVFQTVCVYPFSVRPYAYGLAHCRVLADQIMAAYTCKWCKTKSMVATSMSPPFRVGRHTVFARVVCPSVYQKIVSALYLKNRFRYFHETLHKCKATCDDVQSARTITLDCVFLELWSFEIENSRFCDMVVSAL